MTVVDLSSRHTHARSENIATINIWTLHVEANSLELQPSTTKLHARDHSVRLVALLGRGTLSEDSRKNESV